jgi:hypothetical protein
MKINPYKTGLNFYIILIVFTFTILGCKTFQQWNDHRIIKQEAKNILNTPNLIQYK